MIHATMFEAKTKLSQLVKKALAGEEVVITSGRKKTPVVRLQTIEPVKKKRLGALAHLGYVLPESFFDPLPEEELAAWEGGDE